MRAPEIWKRCPAAIREPLPAWILARVIVLASLGAAKFVVDEYPRGALARSAQVSLVGWDGGFYDLITRSGYAVQPESYRFFPGYPLAARALDVVTPGSSRVALVLLANVCSFAFVVLLYALVMRETADADTARRASWFGCIAPPAFVMVWGYAEPQFLLLSVATFFMLRTRRFAGAAVFAALAALTRPLGLVIAIPAVIEAIRGFDRAGARERVERVLAIVGAPVGALVYLVWVRGQTGDLLEPYRIQAESTRRGAIVDPFTGVWHALREFFDHSRVGPLLHVGWAVMMAIVLIMVTRSRLRWLWLLHPVVTVFVVVVTANHYWLDGIVSLVLLGCCLPIITSYRSAFLR